MNIGVTLLERRAGILLRSDFLMADAHQTAADILISAGVMVGIGLAALGVPHADVGASLVVAVAVAVIGWQIVRRTAAVQLDHSAIPHDQIDAVVRRVGGVRSWHKIRTRGRADEVFMDLPISVDPGISVQRGHGIAHDLQDLIRERFPQVTDVTVHVEPDPPV